MGGPQHGGLGTAAMIHSRFINKALWLEEAIAKAWRRVVIVARALRSIIQTWECPGGLLGERRGPGIPMRFPASVVCNHG